MHRQFFGKVSQNPENVKYHCNEINNPFHIS